MGDRTGIAWTDHTWNPWQGCHKISPGCANCYMYRDKRRYGQDPTVVVQSKRPTFTAPLRWMEPARVFVCSWSDFFIEEADPWRTEAWEIIRRTPHLTYQLLTKRPERIRSCLPADWGKGWPNVWLGITAENQEMLELRYRYLREMPAVVRFISWEPAIGPLDLDGILWQSCTVSWGPGEEDWDYDVELAEGAPQWVIVGSETGPSARPVELDWIRKVRDQCWDAGVAFFLKQLGNQPGLHNSLDGKVWQEFPTGSEVGQCRT